MSLTGPQLPWPADRRPLSVVAFANSVGTLQLPVRNDRAEGTYVEVLADLLATVGVPAVPHVESRWFDFLHRAMRDYESRVRPAQPDVLIVHFGLNEYQPWLTPVWLIRHLLVQNQAASRTAIAYRQHVARPVWKQIRRYRQWAAGKVGARTWQTTPARFAGQLRRLIRTARTEGRPLVLVLDIDRPSGTLAHFLPGLPERHAIFQRAINDAVGSFNDPEVRVVRVSELTVEGDAHPLPDGMHFSAARHAAVGELLSAEILSWLQTRSRAG